MRELNNLAATDRSVIERNNVRIEGRGSRPMMFCAGLGADQTLWKSLTPYFSDEWRIVLFDHVGAGGSDHSAYHFERYRTLEGYADDVIEICQALELKDAVFVGHSIGSIIGVKASNAAPKHFAALILIGASARYLNDTNYFGGFERHDIDEFLFLLQTNHEAWSQQMAPLLMANQDRPELTEQLSDAFARMEPSIARQFAEAAMLCDARADVAASDKPALLVECTGDIIVPIEAGRSMHRHMKLSDYVLLNASGHFPHLSATRETAAAMQEFLDGIKNLT